MLRALDSVLIHLAKNRDNNAMTDGEASLDNNVVVLVAGAGRGPLVTSTLEAYEFILKQHQHEMDTESKSSIPALTVYAVEKNPSAIVYLLSMVQNDPLWKKYNINVVHQDARSLTSRAIHNNKVDIVISELLGSFGDNELSPECLEALLASDVCKPTTLSVPMRYTSHLAPVSSFRLYSEAKHQAQLPAVITMGGGGINGNSTTTNTTSGQSMGMLAACETPYVVRAHSATQTHAELDCWSFSHDGTAGSNKPANLTRMVHLEFAPDVAHGAGRGSGSHPLDRSVANLAANNEIKVPSPITVHGFLGTFTADLFDEAHPSVRRLMGISPNAPASQEPTQISTAPGTYSKDMCSWFPLYFPLREPLPVPAGASVGVSIWRRTDSATGYTQPAPTNGGSAGSGSAQANSPPQSRVWYEWTAKVLRGGEVLTITPIHNPNGRSYHVSM